MKLPLVKIGNSRGIRIPKPIIEQAGLGNEVDLSIVDNSLVIRASGANRAGWDEAFAQMAKNDDDELIDSILPSFWDSDEWEWK